MIKLAVTASLALLLSSCMHSGAAPGNGANGANGPLFPGTGAHRRAISSSTPAAQRFFDQGLAFLYAFNHDEARRSFQRAAALAPNSPMPLWGIATACGPHINNPVVPPERAEEGLAAVRAAQARLAVAPAVERALVEAAAARFADPPPPDRRPLDEAYAAAMREAWRAHPRDADVGALFAEALMDLRPWDLWSAEGKPQPGTDEIVRVLEEVLALDPRHPLALHLYIHAIEASPTPERAMAAADRLRGLTPGLGHLVHMPSHIDVRTGRWAEAVEANQRAMAADDAYEAAVPQQGFYRIYMTHNRHMLAYAAMMRGQSALALGAVDDLVARIPADWLRDNAGLADGMLALPLETRMRFGRWDEILAVPDFPEQFPLARSLRLAARGVALAAQGKPGEARAEQDAFLDARAEVPGTAIFGNNKALDLLQVASRLLEGEILVAEGDLEGGVAALKEAVSAEDQLRYEEPPDWIQPVRHALGAALLRAKKPGEAERVYREDLRRQPDNGWSLWGLGRSLRLQHKDDEAKLVEARFQEVWRDADITLSSSCLCLPGV